MAMLQTPIYQSHVALKAKIVAFAGYDMPLNYQKMIDEHLWVRKSSGLFDVSHMARLHVRGKQATEFCRRISVNNTNKLADGRGMYSVICNEKGGAIDDFSVFRHQADHFELIVNASRRKAVWAWLNQQILPGVKLEDTTDATALLALQGPKTTAWLTEQTRLPLSSLKLFGFISGELLGVKVTLFRSGYTGEDGYEIECRADQARRLWDGLLERAGSDLLRPIGLGARDTLRLEMGYMLYGHELNEEITPLEAGLHWVVKLDDDDFIGKEALLKQAKQGVKKKLVGLRGSERVIPRQGYEVFSDGKVGGWVSSGGYSPSLRNGLGLAYVESDLATKAQLELKIRGEKIAVDVQKPPFINIKR